MKKIAFGLITVLIVGIMIRYYSTTISMKEAFKENDIQQIIQINVGFYFKFPGTMEPEFSDKQMKEKKEINQVVQLLDRLSLNRQFSFPNITGVIGEDKLARDARYISFYLIDKDEQMKMIELNDQGGLRIDGDLYQYSVKKEDVFDELAVVLFNENN